MSVTLCLEILDAIITKNYGIYCRSQAGIGFMTVCLFDSLLVSRITQILLVVSP